ncbi:geranylgeranyl pyrophosphate synthase [Corynebacterium atypicum]|uniref:Geranylgeranyl pyrophosphate synthase n=1 Tax=Corynebacterium atypicum TaxID=191610 RepID=A0ABM5QLL4_9CORY|nr:geranylgeranyl pyrophosphate synthase [Corynebacterium atypicum]
MTHGDGTPDVVSGTLSLEDEALTRRLNAAMAQTEQLLEQKISEGDEIVTDKVLHLARAGGKRFRPMFALLASEYGPQPMNPDVIKAAVIVEMTHLATLYHDDVMDEAQRRRGVESANARWGNSVAILAGDHLLAQTSGLMADLGVDTVRHFSETFGELVTGQMRETVGPRGGDPIEHYTQVIREKTGVLIASAGYLGGLHGGATSAEIAALYGYGRAIGMVFQIVDDIIDVFSTPDQSGKQRGTDLREGVFTLPVLYALAEEGTIADRLRELLTGPISEDAELAEALDLLGRSGGRERALVDVRGYVDEALACLEGLPDGPVTSALAKLATFTARRVG